MKTLYLFAKEDIYDEYSQNVVYLKDELVGNLNLIKEGENQIFKGNYYLQESLDKEVVDIRVEEKLEDFKYYENLFIAKKSIHLLLDVIDAYTHEVIEGVHLGIFSKEDIYDTHNQLVYHKDDFILDIVSQKNHLYQVPFFNIHKGTFYIVQINEVEGYLENTNQYDFCIESSKIQQDIPITISCFPTVVEISKKDENNEFLKGAWLGVYDEKGRLVDEWISEKEHCIYGLKVGKVYVIKEMSVPKGYQKSKDVFFIVNGKQRVQKINLINQKYICI